MLIFAGSLDQAALDGLRGALNLGKRGRLSDREDALFGRAAIPAPDGSTLELELWRDEDAGPDQNPWSIVLKAPAGAQIGTEQIAQLRARSEAAAGSVGLRLAEARMFAVDPPADYQTEWRNPPLARTSHEAHLHMELTPCLCGGRRFNTSSVMLDLPGGAPGRRYTRTCQACGSLQEFTYRLPEEPLESPGFAYGGEEPSEVLDAAQWLWVADWYARAVPPDPARLPPDERRVAQGRLAAAVAAIDEIAKFIPPGADRVPPEAVWTPMGESVRSAEGERLSAGRLAAVRSAYAEVLDSISD